MSARSEIEIDKDIPIIILCGGKGTRFREETTDKPKPMVTVGDRPMLHHVMGIFANQGYRNFYVALGYRGDVVKRYFRDLILEKSSEVSFDFSSNKTDFSPRIFDRDGWINRNVRDYKVKLIETGEESLTAKRIREVYSYIPYYYENVIVTYGDGVADVDVRELLEYHVSHKALATVTAVHPKGRFGVMDLGQHSLYGSNVLDFSEKTDTDNWVNGGFFVFRRDVFSNDYITINDEPLEQGPLQRLTHDNQLRAYRHEGFWQCMDTQRDWQALQDMWNEKEGDVPWLKKRST